MYERIAWRRWFIFIVDLITHLAWRRWFIFIIYLITHNLHGDDHLRFALNLSTWYCLATNTLLLCLSKHQHFDQRLSFYFSMSLSINIYAKDDYFSYLFIYVCNLLTIIYIHVCKIYFVVVKEQVWDLHLIIFYNDHMKIVTHILSNILKKLEIYVNIVFYFITFFIFLLL